MSNVVQDPTQHPEAELLLEVARARAGTALDTRELTAEGLVAAALTVIAVAMAVSLSAGSHVALGTSLVLVLLYAAAREVRFEVGTGYTCPLILVLVPMLFLVPAPLVPVHVAAGLTLGALVTRGRGRRLRARVLLAFGQSWHSVGPALVFIAAGVTAPDPATGRSTSLPC